MMLATWIPSEAVATALGKTPPGASAWPRRVFLEAEDGIRHLTVTGVQTCALPISLADQLATELTWQMGRPLAHSPLEIRRGFAERASYMIGIAGGALADIVPEPKEGFRR